MRADEGFRPRVALVIAAYNEDDVIAAKLENALALDYPRELLRIVVASDASSDGTDEIVRGFADRGVELVRAPRGGKVNAQNARRAHARRRRRRRVLGRQLRVAAGRARTARRAARRPGASPTSAAGCSCARPRARTRRAPYWRYEIWLRARESLVHSVTGGNGSIYAVRRERYEEVDPRFGHDLSFPYLMVKRGFRAVYAPRAVALEKMTTDLADEFRRKVRMFGHCWLLVLHGRMFGLRALGPLYWVEMVSHRLLRYASGLLHLALLATSIVLAFAPGGVYAVVLGAARRVRALRAGLDRAARAASGCFALAALLPARDARHPARARATSCAACPPSGSARRARGERRGRVRQARASTSSARAAGLALAAPLLALAALRDQARGRRARCCSARSGSAAASGTSRSSSCAR